LSPFGVIVAAVVVAIVAVVLVAPATVAALATWNRMSTSARISFLHLLILQNMSTCVPSCLS
jgi:hypothetical protein